MQSAWHSDSRSREGKKKKEGGTRAEHRHCAWLAPSAFRRRRAAAELASELVSAERMYRQRAAARPLSALSRPTLQQLRACARGPGLGRGTAGQSTG